MNITSASPKSRPAELVCRVTYPSVGRSLVDGMLMLGRTGLITGAGAAVLLGSAMAIGYVLATALGLLGLDAAGSY